MFKFLDPTGCTYYEGSPFVYNLPRRGEKWAITMHPDPAEPDGYACGPGRLHIMRKLDAMYAPRFWWPWWAKAVGEETGSDNEKVSARGVALRRITPHVLWRALRLPFNWGRNADLAGANLRIADLTGADLRGAYLRGAYLTDARWNRHTRWPVGFVVEEHHMIKEAR